MSKITVTACRIQKRKGSFKINKEMKGQFKLSFNSLEELAMYCKKSRFMVFMPNLETELTEEQLRVLNSKFRAIM